MSPTKNILVIKFRNIGDVLLTSPLISSLKTGSKKTSVFAIVKPGTEEMLTGHPHLDGLFILPKRTPNESLPKFILRYASWLQSIRRLHIDICINTTEGDRGILLSYIIGAKERWSEVRNKKWHQWLLTKSFKSSKLPTHTIKRNLDCAQNIVGKISGQVHLTINPKDEFRVLTLLERNGRTKNKKLIHIHPTSRWFFKCWKDELVAILIDKLIGDGLEVAISCSSSNEELRKVERITNMCRTKPINLGGELALKEVAALSRLADLFIGVDSAPMHMAAAVNTPVIGLFGPSGAFNWGPWPNETNPMTNPYPKRNGTQYAGPHVVIQKNWACVPCGKDGCEGSKKSACLDMINPETVFSIATKKINERND
jgi:heptosyltransferase-3